MPRGIYERKPFTQKHLENMGKAKKGAKHPKWKGDDVSYRALHSWVMRCLGKPKECSICGKEKNRMSWSNIDHKYRRVLSDYAWMCPGCHGIYDKINSLRLRKHE